jgi:hypothetical protein
VKITALYQIPGYKILELVVESEPISSFDQYNSTSISGISNCLPLKKSGNGAKDKLKNRVKPERSNIPKKPKKDH